MANPKKPKMIVREIKNEMKVTEIAKEEPETEETSEESSLEDLTADAPSGRDFPQFNQAAIRGQAVEDLPAAEEKKEENQGPVYNVQNVTEKEIRRVYETRESSLSSRGVIRNPVLQSSREQRGNQFANQEIEDLRRQRVEEEGDKYDVSPTEPHQASKRKYPWEA
jgi:hypothetical protein